MQGLCRTRSGARPELLPAPVSVPLPLDSKKGRFERAIRKGLLNYLMKFYHWSDTTTNSSAMDTDKISTALDRIEAEVERLQKRVDALERENSSLLARQEALMAERAGLLARNDEARTRVEAMIERLKQLETAN